MPKPNPPASKTGRRAASRFPNTVTYRAANGHTFEAKIVGGSGTSLNLRVPQYPVASRELTGIAKRTSRTQTNVWF